MYCIKCGKETNNNQKICDECLKKDIGVQNKQNNISKTKKVKVIVALAILVILVVIATIIFWNLFNKPTNINNENVNTEISNKKYPEEQITKIDSNQDYIYEDTSKTISRTELASNQGTVDIKIPKLNLTGKYAEEFSKTLDEKISIYNTDESLGYTYININYDWSNYQDKIISLLVNITSGTMNSESNTEYLCFNINLENGQPITIQEACSTFNIDQEDVKFAVKADKVTDNVSLTDTNRVKGYYIDNFNQMHIICQSLELVGTDYDLNVCDEVIVKNRNTFTVQEINKYLEFNSSVVTDYVGKEINIIGTSIKIVKQIDDLHYLCELDTTEETEFLSSVGWDKSKTFAVIDSESYQKINEVSWGNNETVYATYKIKGTLNFILPNFDTTSIDTINQSIIKYHLYNYIQNATIEKIEENNEIDYQKPSPSSSYIKYTLSGGTSNLDEEPSKQILDLEAISEAYELLKRNPFLYADFSTLTIKASNFKVNIENGKQESITINNKTNNYSYTFNLNNFTLSELNIDENNIYTGTIYLTISLFATDDNSFVVNIEQEKIETLDLYNINAEQEPLKTYIQEHAGIYTENNENFLKEYTLISPYITKTEDGYMLSVKKMYDEKLNILWDNTNNSILRNIINIPLSANSYNKIKDLLISADKEGYKIINALVTVYNNGTELEISKFKNL